MTGGGYNKILLLVLLKYIEKKVVNHLFFDTYSCNGQKFFCSKHWIPWRTGTKNNIGNRQIYPQFVLELKWHISMDIWYSAGKYILLLLLSSFFPCTGKSSANFRSTEKALSKRKEPNLIITLRCQIFWDICNRKKRHYIKFGHARFFQLLFTVILNF